jgi:hypothetical protein
MHRFRLHAVNCIFSQLRINGCPAGQCRSCGRLGSLWMKSGNCSLAFGMRLRRRSAGKNCRAGNWRNFEELMGQIKTMRHLLQKMMDCCRCDTLDQCGRGIFKNGFAEVTVKSLPVKGRAGRLSR